MKVFEVQCESEKHKIGISRRGKLVFFNHMVKELENEKILEKISDTESLNNCYKFLKLWRSWSVEKMLKEYNNPQLIEMINDREKIKIKRLVSKR